MEALKKELSEAKRRYQKLTDDYAALKQDHKQTKLQLNLAHSNATNLINAYRKASDEVKAAGDLVLQNMEQVSEGLGVRVRGEGRGSRARGGRGSKATWLGILSEKQTSCE